MYRCGGITTLKNSHTIHHTGTGHPAPVPADGFKPNLRVQVLHISINCVMNNMQHNIAFFLSFIL